MKRFVLIFTITLCVLTLGYFIYSKLIKDESNNRVITPITKENFTLNYQYKGDNLWEYFIDGYLPNPCYTYKVESAVLESYPEQVIISVKITPPSLETICDQVIQDIHENGSINVSEMATFDFNVVLND